MSRTRDDNGDASEWTLLGMCSLFCTCSRALSDVVPNIVNTVNTINIINIINSENLEEGENSNRRT